MKLYNLTGIAISLGLCLSTGCHHRPEAPFAPPPGLQPSYVEAGDTLRWVASGQPFQISFFPMSPCKDTDNLVNQDGKTDIVCHVKSDFTGNYSYSYLSVNDERGHRGRRPGQNKVHVGPCTACSVIISGPKGPGKSGNGDQTTGQPAASTQDVILYCADGKPAADPASATASTVVFEFQGQLPQPGFTTPLFSVAIGPNVCSDYPAGTVLNMQDASCNVAKASKYTVSGVYGCDKDTFSGTVSPPQ